jgi:hypothetical protein
MLPIEACRSRFGDCTHDGETQEAVSSAIIRQHARHKINSTYTGILSVHDFRRVGLFARYGS